MGPLYPTLALLTSLLILPLLLKRKLYLEAGIFAFLTPLLWHWMGQVPPAAQATWPTAAGLTPWLREWLDLVPINQLAVYAALLLIAAIPLAIAGFRQIRKRALDPTPARPMSIPAAKDLQDTIEQGSLKIVQDISPLAEAIYQIQSGPEAWNEESHAQYKTLLERYQREIQALTEELVGPTPRPALEIIEDIQESIKTYRPSLDTHPSRTETALQTIDQIASVIQAFSELSL